MTNAQMIAAFNEWMRRYIEEPERFEAEFKSVLQFKADEAAGKTPSYGETCAALLEKISAELAA